MHFRCLCVSTSRGNAAEFAAVEHVLFSRNFFFLPRGGRGGEIWGKAFFPGVTDRVRAQMRPPAIDVRPRHFSTFPWKSASERFAPSDHSAERSAAIQLSSSSDATAQLVAAAAISAQKESALVRLSLVEQARFDAFVHRRDDVPRFEWLSRLVRRSLPQARQSLFTTNISGSVAVFETHR